MSFVSELIENFVNPNDVVKVELKLSRDRTQVLRFRVVTDEVEYNKLQKQAAEWITETNELAKRGILPPALVNHYDDDPKLLAEVFLLAELAVDVDQKRKSDWLELARKGSPVFRSIFTMVENASLKNREQLLASVIEMEKKDSSPQPTKQE